jgi:hypothetical protein
MKRALLVGALWGAVAVAGADEVLLKNGGRVSGVIVEQTARTVVVDIGAGLVSLKQIKGGQSQLVAFRDREARLLPDDVEGWLELARWAEDAQLRTPAREAYQRVLQIDPQNPSAHTALGDVFLGGRWLGAQDAYRAQGLVNFEGAWVTPQQQQATLAQRAAEDNARQRRDEDVLRLREIEARTRLAEAEADARRGNNTGASDWQSGGGIPIWGHAGGPCVVDSPYCVDRGHSRPHPHVSPPAPPPPTRPPAPPPSDNGGGKPPRSAHAGVARRAPQSDAAAGAAQRQQ